MHLLLSQQGQLSDADEAIDLGQTPADIIFLTAADSEIAALAEAQSRAFEASVGPTLRCANFTQLSHNMSVDVYVRDMVSKAKLVVVRALGGVPYWQYGLERCRDICAEFGCKLIVLPGDDKPDPELSALCNVDAENCFALWQYFCHGGPDNMRHALSYMCYLLGETNEPAAAVPLMRAGLYHPHKSAPTLDDFREEAVDGQIFVGVIFYRALLQGGSLASVITLCDSLREVGLSALPIFVSSLKDEFSKDVVRKIYEQMSVCLTINLTSFAAGSPASGGGSSVLDEMGAPVIQALLSSSQYETWQASDAGLTPRDLAMGVALPEVDGRIISTVIAFKSAQKFDSLVEANIVTHEPVIDHCHRLAKLAARYSKLSAKNAEERRVGIVLANYPNRDGRLGNGVGLDTPQGVVELLKAMIQDGYEVGNMPADGNALIEHLMAGPTNAARDGRQVREVISLSHYNDFFGALSKQIQRQVVERWGAPEDDPFFMSDKKSFALPLSKLGNVWLGIQPARGYNIDPKETYHAPDLVPPHGYIAFYAFLRVHAPLDAIVHMGKHGNLEWLPGKANALSDQCYPEALIGDLPHFYPFIVNDPGEGTQAKRRTHAAIIDHLTPPLTRAETYGPLRDLEALVDEYYLAAGSDPKRLNLLKKKIMEAVFASGLDQDAGIDEEDETDAQLEKLDAYLCDLKEMQIRDGLHVFGLSPQGRLKRDLAIALARLPRHGSGELKDESLLRALAEDFGFEGFDPLDCDFAEKWNAQQPEALLRLSTDAWRHKGDTVERLELYAQAMLDGEVGAVGPKSEMVFDTVQNEIEPTLDACGKGELAGILAGLAGKHVPSGPSGAPTRGRMDVLPTGRNFYSVDSRAVPSRAAWELGKKSAELVVLRHVQDNGEWPTSFGLSAWGTSNMRTGGDDIAQAFAFVGAKPVWDKASHRVTGFEITPLAELGRPRVDVTLRISGFFRDAFPSQIQLFDQAVRAISQLNESPDQNPIAARYRKELDEKMRSGMAQYDAEREAGYRIFGSKPGAYGAGLQAMFDENLWDNKSDLAASYINWGGYAYGAKEEGVEARDQFAERLGGIEAVVHNQDNREHDLLDSDDYYQFEGGMTAAVENTSGEKPIVYHNDHSRPERPVVRRLEEEISRVVRARVTNPKWISGVMRHGYKGAFEMAATVDYMFAFSATTGAVKDHHFEAVHDAFLADDEVREFIEQNNPNALADIVKRMNEAIERGLWTPKRNSITLELDSFLGGEDGKTN